MKNKKVVLIFVLVILSVLTFSFTRTAKAQTIPTYDSAIQIQNLDAINAVTINITYYNFDGTLATMDTGFTNPVETSILEDSSATFLPIHPAAGFKGSAVVSSLGPIAIISNLNIAATNRALGTYVGSATGSSAIYFPLVDRRNNVSVFSIQNTGSVDAAVIVDYTPAPGMGFADLTNTNLTIKPGASSVINMTNVTSSNWLGSIKATATTGSITGILSNTNFTVLDSPMNAVYNSFSSGSATSILPLVMEANNGNRTGTSCQNLGPNPATITITYQPSTGFTARSADVFADIPVNGIAVKLFSDTGTRWVGGSLVTIDNGSTVVCVVNQSRPAFRNSSLYEGFNPAVATSKVVMPLIMANNGSTTKTFTNFSVASANGTNIDVTCDWKPSAGFPDIANTTKNGAPVLVFPQQVGFSPSEIRWIGSAVCTEKDGKGIVAVVNQSRTGLPVGYKRDVTSAYDAFIQ